MENGSATDATDRSRVRSERQRTTVKKEPRSASKRERRRTGKQNLCARFVDLFIYPLFFNLPFFYDVVPRLRTRRSELCDSRESRSDETVKVQRTRESENFFAPPPQRSTSSGAVSSWSLYLTRCYDPSRARLPLHCANFLDDLFQLSRLGRSVLPPAQSQLQYGQEVSHSLFTGVSHLPV
jgi:hypothetical protein